MPTPKEGETKTQFVSRCSGSEKMKSEFPDQKQRVAVCYQIWKDWKKKKGK